MSLADRLHRLVPDLWTPLARFPVPVAISAALCVYGNIDVAIIAVDGFAPGNQIYLAGGVAFLAAGVAHYLAQSRRYPRAAEILLALLGALAAGALAYWDAHLRSSHIFLFAGLLLLLMIAGFLRRDAKQGALWLFNLRLGLAALLAIIVALVAGGGVSAVLASLKFLFNAELTWKAHEYVWVTAITLIGPLCGLSLAPANFDEEMPQMGGRDTLLDRGVSVLVNYILVPLAVVYALILHAYAVKILIDGTLPKGQIALMVSIFAVGGTATWLIAWPWRETGTVVLRLFMRYWFWFTIIPVILLAVAIRERLATYGATPERYGVIVIAVWLAFVTFYLAMRHNRADMRVVLGSLAVLVLIGSAGPWGVNNVSIESQFARLVRYVQAEGLLTQEGRIVDQPVSLTSDSKKEIGEILWFLENMGALDKLKPLFAGHKDDPFSEAAAWNIRSRIREILALDDYTPPPVEPTQVRFVSTGTLTQEIKGAGRLIGPAYLRSAPIGTQQGDAMLRNADRSLYITVEGRTWSTPSGPLLVRLREAATTHRREPLALEIDPTLTLVITEARGALGEPPFFTSGAFWFILTP